MTQRNALSGTSPEGLARSATLRDFTGSATLRDFSASARIDTRGSLAAVEDKFNSWLVNDKQRGKVDLKNAWMNLDSGNGKASLAEIDNWVVISFPKLSNKPALMEAYKAADVDENSYITKEEFPGLLRNILYFNKLFQVFDGMDESKDRRVSFKEFKDGLNISGLQNIDRPHAVFKSIDENGSGSILFSEFCKWVAERDCPIDSPMPVATKDEPLKFLGTRLRKSASATDLAPRPGLLGPRCTPLMINVTAKPEPVKKTRPKDVTEEQVKSFCFPADHENPESTGRLMLLARYGPVDEDGKLRGGTYGSHVHSDLEIHQMIRNETREALFSLFKKPRETVEVIVDSLMPGALKYNYTWADLKQLLKPCFAQSTDGKLNFHSLQQLVLKNQRERLKAIVKDGPPSKERGPRVPFQSKPAEILMAPYTKKDLNDQEHQELRNHQLHRYGTLLMGIEDQSLSHALAANAQLCRGLGDLNDKWDRYCAHRRTGRASYVMARNHSHTGLGCMDDGLTNKCPGISSLVSSGYSKGPSL